MARSRFNQAVNDQSVAVVDATANHGVTRDFDKERRGRVLDQQVIQAECAFNIVLSGTGKPSVDMFSSHRDLEATGTVSLRGREHSDRNECAGRAMPLRPLTLAHLFWSSSVKCAATLLPARCRCTVL